LPHPIPFLELGNLHPCPIFFFSILWCSHNGACPKTYFTLILQNLLKFLFWKKNQSVIKYSLKFYFYLVTIWQIFTQKTDFPHPFVNIWTKYVVINSPDLLPLLDPVKCQWCQRPWWPPRKAINFFLDIYYIPKI